MEYNGICILTNNVPRPVEFYSKVLDVKAEGITHISFGNFCHKLKNITFDVK